MKTSPTSLFSGNGNMAFKPGPALRQLGDSDPTLARLIATVGPFRMQVKAGAGVFHALAEAIVYQQLSTRAAATIHGRLVGLFPSGGLTPEAVLGATDEALRSAGLSRAKLLALRDLARRTEGGKLPSEADIATLDDETIIERLTQVRGVGRWTAEMYLMFRLGRPDVLPVADLGLRKGFARAWGLADLPAPAELARHGSRWAPWRTVASWYLWRALDLPEF